MSGAPEEFRSYLSMRVDEETKMPDVFRISTSLEEAEAFKEEPEHQDELFSTDTKPSKIEYAEDKGNLNSFARFCDELILSFQQSLTPYHDLTYITNDLRPFYVAQVLKAQVVENVRQNGHLLRNVDGKETYGLSVHLFNEVTQSINRLRRTDTGLALLPSSVLLSLVATFDSLIGDSIKALLRLRPERITTSERTISYKELFSIQNLEDAKEQFIEEEVDRLLRGNHDTQIEYVEKLVDTKIRESYPRYSSFLEIFERRNIVAHANGFINQGYINKCRSFSHECEEASIGKKASLKPDYLHRSIDILTEFGVLLAFVAWRKLDGSSENAAFGKLNDVALEAIRQKRYELAIWLLDFALNKQPRKGAYIPS